MALRGLFVCLALFAFLLQVGDAVGSDVAGAPASGGELGDRAELSFRWAAACHVLVLFRGLNVVYGMNGIVLWCTFLHFHLLRVKRQNVCPESLIFML